MAASSPYALGILNLFFLLVGIVVLTVVNVYVLVKWQHPEDKNQWVSAKAAVVLGMLVTELVIVGLPLDVANNGGARDCSYDWGDTAECGGLDMRAYWLSVFGLAIAWVWVVIPTYVFAYEAHDELGEHTTGDTFKAAACSEFGLLVVFLIIVIPMYFIINEVKLPVRDSVAKTSLRISRDVARRAARDSFDSSAAARRRRREPSFRRRERLFRNANTSPRISRVARSSAAPRAKRIFDTNTCVAA